LFRLIFSHVYSIKITTVLAFVQVGILPEKTL